MTQSHVINRLVRLGIYGESFGYKDGPNKYQFVQGNPVNFTDPTGLATGRGSGVQSNDVNIHDPGFTMEYDPARDGEAVSIVHDMLQRFDDDRAEITQLELFGVGHHVVPCQVWEYLPDSPGRKIFNRFVTGALEGGHGNSAAHIAYNAAVKEIFAKWAKENGVNIAKISEEEALQFLKLVFASENPAIRGFLRGVAKQFRPIAQEAIERAVIRELEEKGEKAIAEEIAQRGGKQVAQRLVRGMMKELPLVAVAFILYDVKEGGVAYAARNAVVPADAIGEILLGLSGNFQEFEDRFREGLQENRISKTGIDPNALDPSNPIDQALESMFPG